MPPTIFALSRYLRYICEVHALLRLVDEQDLGTIEHVFCSQQVHIQAEVRDFCIADLISFAGVFLVGFIVLQVFFIGNSEYRSLGHAAWHHLAGALRGTLDSAELDTLLGFDDYGIAVLQVRIFRSERIGPTAVVKFHGYAVGIVLRRFRCSWFIHDSTSIRYMAWANKRLRSLFRFTRSRSSMAIRSLRS